uniref:Uncharacterized protein n=1 Tax=Nelumbo nucifera TaxID=4432 RepID=A0A822ZN34_NELNU|nr:TPA_asm: hypothetical protein HUJ06_004120 [Nelumbo nucifera]
MKKRKKLLWKKRRLKLRFKTWKKEYKLKLRETKATLHKLGNSEVEKTRRKWWGKKSTRGTKHYGYRTGVHIASLESAIVYCNT